MSYKHKWDWKYGFSENGAKDLICLKCNISFMTLLNKVQKMYPDKIIKIEKIFPCKVSDEEYERREIIREIIE